MALVVTCGGAPNHKVIGFAYWHNHGATNDYILSGISGRLVAFIATLRFSVYIFAFTPELLVITAGEMQTPRENFRRSSSDASASPWAIAAKDAGIKSLDSVINVVILLSAWSAGNSWLYIATRTLYSMATVGTAPKIFKRCTASGVPYMSLAFTSLFCLLAYMNVNSSAATVFNWFVNLWDTSTFVTSYAGIPIFVVFYLGHKLFTGRDEAWLVLCEDVDLVTGLAEIFATEIPTSTRSKGWLDVIKVMSA
ncbi:hypothetical protein AnigIFM62618_007008 [Aspergillus niger]|nr:hypothetical protein AnigIFM62618_007008 [Aspergillus niger]